MTRASILIPIHNKPTTLPLTVDTVLRQSVTDLEVLLIGDGVTDQVRTVAEELVRADGRVRFLDFPKGPHHGERYRHDAIMAARSEAIFYLCDDDLLLPEHVADLVELLGTHDLVQCLNGQVTADGEVRLYAADLSDPACIALHVREDLQFNSVSITGTAHTRAAYLRVTPWDTTPRGQFPDHWQFRKLMRLPDFRGATSRRMTALQFPTTADGRDAWDAEARVQELVPWHALVSSPGAQVEVDRLVREGTLAQLIEARGQLSVNARDVDVLRRDLTGQVDTLRAEVDHLWRELEAWQAHASRLADIRAQREATIDELRGRLQHKRATIARLRARLRSRQKS